MIKACNASDASDSSNSFDNSDRLGDIQTDVNFDTADSSMNFFAPSNTRTVALMKPPHDVGKRVVERETALPITQYHSIEQHQIISTLCLSAQYLTYADHLLPFS